MNNGVLVEVSRGKRQGCLAVITGSRDVRAETPKYGGLVRMASSQHGPDDTLDPLLFKETLGYTRDLSGQRLLTSTAQMFDERGKGLIVRGGRARIDKGDRHPYLDRADAYDLVRRSLKAFFNHHYHYPARIVVFKTSRFEGGEVDGIGEALREANIAHSDLVWISENSPITLHREGSYPPFRGTLVGLGGNAVLFTRGSVPYYRTYPGLRVPNPLMLRPHRHDTPLTDIARDVLALSKMNWNTTQFDGALPIPIMSQGQFPGDAMRRVKRHAPRLGGQYTRRNRRIEGQRQRQAFRGAVSELHRKAHPVLVLGLGARGGAWFLAGSPKVLSGC